MKGKIVTAGKLNKKQMGLWGEILEPIQKKRGEENHIIRKTVRSGQRIEREGNVVVLGDVNPGGQVVATGDIIVFGSIKGVVHAGVRGNEQARIMAWDLKPTQLRIAGLITRAPDNKKEHRGPEIASIVNNRIVVDSYSKTSF